jgi:hypothetical protein
MLKSLLFRSFLVSLDSSAAASAAPQRRRQTSTDCGGGAKCNSGKCSNAPGGVTDLSAPGAATVAPAK